MDYEQERAPQERWDKNFLDALNEIKAAGGIREINIAMFEGRPVRDTCIMEDDITNLKIALNTATTIDEFCKMV